MKRLLKPEILAVLAAIFTVAVWGETFVSTKLVLNNGLKPSDIFFYRFLIAYVFIWTISPKVLFSQSLHDEIRFFLMGTTGGCLYFLCENTALAYSTASNVSILVGSAPLFTALLLGAVYKEERLSLRQIAGSFIAFSGMALVVFNGKFVLQVNPLGDALAIAAACVWACYSLILKRLSAKYDVRFITRKVFAYGLFSMGIYLLTIHPLCVDTSILFRPVVLGNVLYLGIVASLLCFVLWNWALSKLGIVRTTNIVYIQSFFTMIVASIVLGERITWMAVIGTIVLICGMLLIFKKTDYE